MARFVHGVAISDPTSGGHGIQSLCAGYDGVWWDGEFEKLPCIYVFTMLGVKIPAEWCWCCTYIASPRVGGATAIISGLYAVATQSAKRFRKDKLMLGQDAPTGNISLYGLKRASDDIAALAKEIGAPQIILGGHDW
jgi:hypothetical protein